MAMLGSVRLNAFAKGWSGPANGFPILTIFEVSVQAIDSNDSKAQGSMPAASSMMTKTFAARNPWRLFGSLPTIPLMKESSPILISGWAGRRTPPSG